MACGAIAPTTVDKIGANSMFVDKLPEEINEMTIKDDKVEKVASCYSKAIDCSGHFIFQSLLMMQLSLKSAFVIGNGSKNDRRTRNSHRTHHNYYYMREKWPT
ncbi:Protein kinase, catalytic domain-containing protein [Artemisia annua]|uniref:Protein kinase, catalytic domain-containing protein n=1 Tax=Artemisia annua TaxID=35608 RepID=A0A2U1LGV9_ARTAN|nr:Protein kinase, catalytic domain-containing protein [Artemisia annua]